MALSQACSNIYFTLDTLSQVHFLYHGVRHDKRRNLALGNLASDWTIRFQNGRSNLEPAAFAGRFISNGRQERLVSSFIDYLVTAVVGLTVLNMRNTKCLF